MQKSTKNEEKLLKIYYKGVVWRQKCKYLYVIKFARVVQLYAVWIAVIAISLFALVESFVITGATDKLISNFHVDVFQPIFGKFSQPDITCEFIAFVFNFKSIGSVSAVIILGVGTIVVDVFKNIWL